MVARLWFTIKVWAFLFVFIWLRTSLPRLRYDQFMNLGWKVLIPISLAWVMVVAIIRAFVGGDNAELIRALISAGAGLVVTGLIAYAIWRMMRVPEVPETAAEPERPAAFDAMAGGFPIPPMPAPDSRSQPVRTDPDLPLPADQTPSRETTDA